MLMTRNVLTSANCSFAGPVFVEFPIDVLYPYKTVAKEIGMKGSSKSLGQRIVNWLVLAINGLVLNS